MSEFLISNLPPRIGAKEHAHQILAHAEHLGSSDVWIQAGRPLFCLVYGRLTQLSSRVISESEVSTLLQAIHSSNAPAMIGARQPINTAIDFNHEVGGTMKHLRFRVNATGSRMDGGRNGITVTLRSIPTDAPTVGDLGIEKEVVDLCSSARQGLFLVVGATGSGKSTTLAALLRNALEDSSPDKTCTHLVTIEHPVEFMLGEFAKRGNSIYTPLEVTRDIESFTHGVENAMRMAPTHILVGETRDKESANACFQSSITGHFVLSTLHASSASETMQRLSDFFDPSVRVQAMSNGLQALGGIMAQRLLPSTDGKRVAAREILIFDRQVKEALAGAADMGREVRNLLRAHGKPMLESVSELEKEGRISSEIASQMKYSYQD